MGVGVGVWGIHFMLDCETFLPTVPLIGSWQIPLSLAATGCSLVGYFLLEPPWRINWGSPNRS